MNMCLCVCLCVHVCRVKCVYVVVHVHRVSYVVFACLCARVSCFVCCVCASAGDDAYRVSGTRFAFSPSLSSLSVNVLHLRLSDSVGLFVHSFSSAF